MTKKPKPRREYWQCPTCTNRYWTLTERDKYLCPACYTRCILIDRKAWLKPDNPRTLATAFVITDGTYENLELEPALELID